MLNNKPLSPIEIALCVLGAVWACYGIIEFIYGF
jgi:hypothetical protein